MEKLAVCSVVTKDFLIYLKVFCASIIKYTKNFDRDYIVYYFDNDLFDDDFIELKRLYSKFIFKKVNEEKYYALNKVSNHKNTPKRTKEIKKFAYARIEMFKETFYDQIIYFDTDMVAINDLSPLFKMRFKNGIIACEDVLVKQYNLVSKEVFERDHKVQGGVILAGKEILNQKVYEELLERLKFHGEYRMNDQTLFTEYFGSRGLLKTLDVRFNCGRKLIRDNLIRKKDVYIIHYPGSGKPFDLKTQKSNFSCYVYDYWHKVRIELQGGNIFYKNFSKFIIYLKRIIKKIFFLIGIKI